MVNMEMRTLPTDGLTTQELRAIQALMDAAFEGDFSETDWQHSLGGTHVVATEDGAVVAHASVVERSIRIDGRAFAAGYVEAVATEPDRQGTGIGSAVMAAIAEVLRYRFELGVLSTSAAHFYERLGWQRWQGTTWVRHPDGTLERTAEEDDGIFVLLLTPSAGVDIAGAMECDARAGEHW